MEILTDEKDYWTLKAMECYGGSFVRALCVAARQADYQNLDRIKKTWPEYWNNYEKMGAMLEKDNNHFQ